MSRPGLPSGVQSAAQLAHVDAFPLVHLEFDSEDGGDLYISGTDFDVDFDGNTYLGSRGLTSMEAIVETPDEVTGVKFTMFATDDMVAETLTAKFQGRPCTVLWALFDSNGDLVVDEQAWQGRMDVPSINRTNTRRVISITAEHRMADWNRPRQLMFNDADQRRIDPDDTFFVGIEGMRERTIIVFNKDVMRLAKG